MRILLILFLSFFVFSDDHDEMYQPGWAEYRYCNFKDGLSDNQIEKILTPIGDDTRVVSPAGGPDINWADIFGPGSPGNLGNSESDATPI